MKARDYIPSLYENHKILPSDIAGADLVHSFGNVYYVMASTDALYSDFFDRYNVVYDDGTNSVHTTITLALAAAGNYDTIILAPGDYDEGAVLNITLNGLRILGPGNDNQHHAMIWSSSASHHLMTINAHHVEIAGVGFTQTKDTKDAIKVSTTASFHKVHIHHCRFDGYGAGEYGVHTGVTYDSPDIIVEDCRFHSWQTVALHVNATRGIYRRNSIHLVAAKVGIEYVPTAGSRPGSFISDNDILGVNSTDTGIKITGTPNAGSMHITRNNICGCATTITQTANNTHHTVNNYKSDGAGGSLIDTVA